MNCTTKELGSFVSVLHIYLANLNFKTLILQKMEGEGVGEWGWGGGGGGVGVGMGVLE